MKTLEYFGGARRDRTADLRTASVQVSPKTQGGTERYNTKGLVCQMSAQDDEKQPEGERKARRAVCRKCGAQAYFTDEFPETCSFCGGELEYRK